MSQDEQTLIDQMVAKAGDHAHNMLVRNKMKMLMPHWFLIDKNGGGEVLVTPWDSDEQKNRIFGLIRLRLRHGNAMAYTFMSEAWMALYDKDEAPKNEDRPAVMPSAHPKRIEVVAIMISTRSKQRMINLEIKRDPAGAVIDLVEVSMIDAAKGEEGGMIGGSIPSLFD
jgi:hypothetical protein